MQLDRAFWDQLQISSELREELISVGKQFCNLISGLLKSFVGCMGRCRSSLISAPTDRFVKFLIN